jgi:RHS repeat-associated protein
MPAPSMRGFQMESGSGGDSGGGNVNLFRGDVNHPLTLVHLPGPDGLDVSLSTCYGSNVGQEVTTWNREAPTGVLGLGWSFSFDVNTFSGGGTASWLEGTFTLITGGNEYPLTVVSWTGTAGAVDETLVFADALNPLWSFSFTPYTETWTVLRDDGITLVFGDSSSGRNTVQWGVRWGNWAGNSSSAGNSPTRFGLAWNLSTMSDPWGNHVTYAYAADTPTVTTVGGKPLIYTRASYLSQITDAYGRTVRFTYGDKDTLEYQAPNTVNGKAPSAAYQDCYETKYLARIDVCPAGSDGSVVYYSVVLGYAVKDLGADANGCDPTTDCCKRYLTSVAHQRNGVDIMPAMTFAYNLEENSTGAGRLTQATYPAGGQVTWTYTDVPLANPSDPQNVFNLTYEAERPSSADYNGVYDDAYPGLWFGTDYVIVGWYAQESQNLLLRVYSYGGRWSEPWEVVLQGVNPATTQNNPTASQQLDAILVAMGSDFFAFYSHNVTAEGTDNLYVYQKAEYQFGQWATPSGAPYSLTNIPDTVTLDETVLVAGRDMAAIHVSGTDYVFRLAYNRVTKTWTGEATLTSATPSTTKAALAAQNNTLAVAFFDGDTTVSSTPCICYLDGAYAWQASPANAFYATVQSFAWQSDYAWTYWQMGQGFAAGTSLQNSDTAQIHLIWWDRNFTGWYDKVVTTQGGNAEASSRIAGSVVSNGGNAWRFDGAQWQFNENGLYWQPSTDFLASTADTVVKVTLDGSLYQSLEGNAFNAVTGEWETFSLSGTPAASYQWPRGPTFLGDYLTIGNMVYYRGTDVSTGWDTPIGSNNPLTPEACSTLTNLGPTFLAYQNNDNRDTSVPADEYNAYVALLKNGDILTIAAPYSEQKVQTAASSALLCGATAFATYSSLANSFGEVASFTLHRILNQAVSDQTDCVVTKVERVTADQTLTTTYTYDAATAVFDASGTVSQYQTVTKEHVDGNGNSLGSTVFNYYNGLPPTSEDAAATSSAGLSLSDCYSLAAGYIQSLVEYDGSGNQVASKTNVWQGLTLTTKSGGGFTLLSNVVLLRNFTSTDTTTSPYITAAGEATGSGQRSYSIAQTYVAQTGHVRSKTTTVYGNLAAASGPSTAAQTRNAELLYAWEPSAFPDMANPGGTQSPMFGAEAQITLYLNGNVVASGAKMYSNAWSSVKAWALSRSWQWNGSGDGSFDFSSPDTSHWLCTSTIQSRNKTGRIEVVKNNLGESATRIFDTTGLYKCGEVINSDGSDFGFFSFEPYELEAPNSCSPWSGGTIASSDAHTGGACAQVAAGGSLTYAGLTAASGQNQYLLGCFVKSASGTTAEVSLTVGGAAATKSVSANPDWQYLFVFADSSGAGVTIDCSIKNTGSNALLIDDVFVAPVLSRYSAKVFNGLMIPTAGLGQNGTTSQAFFDDLLRPLARSRPDDQMTGFEGLGFAENSRKKLTAGYNAKLSLSAVDGGPWDDFRDGEGWTSRWTTAGSGTWSVSDQVLTHTGTASGSVTFNATAGASNYAVHVQASAGASAIAAPGTFGIGIGKGSSAEWFLTAQWNSSAAEWQLLNTSGAILDSFAPETAPTLPCNLLLIATTRSVHLFVNQQLTLSYVFASTDPAIEGALSLFTSASGLGFSQALVFLTPLAGLTFIDGLNRPIQSQSLADTETIVAQNFYDARGRPTIHTKPAIYTNQALGYQSGFAAMPDISGDGVMPSCDLVTYYDGSEGRSNDEGYPYARMVVEDSALSRVTQAGQPGAAHAIGSATGKTSSTTYGTNQAGTYFGMSLTAEEYPLVLKTDPDGLMQVLLKDTIGNHYATACGDAANGLTWVASNILDENDHPGTINAPNGFAPPSGTTPADWQQTATYNKLGWIETHMTPDSGTMQFIYDGLGRARFTLNADGADTSAATSVNPAVPGVAINYTLYDALGRPTETGYTSQSTWDAGTLQANANNPTWLPAAGHPRFKFAYDGDGTTANAHGRVVSIETIQAGGKAVTEAFTYNAKGQVLTAATTMPGGESYSVSYTYAHAGRLISKTIPSLGSAAALTEERTYDPRGKLSTITVNGIPQAEYTWNAAGQILTETLGGGKVSRTYAYTPTGRLSSISGTETMLDLYYETEPSGLNPNTNPWTARYNGLPSALRYKFGDGNEKTWTYVWDNQKRLSIAYGSDGEKLTYAYDDNGNATQYGDTRFTYAPKTNQIQSVSGTPGMYAYTPSGKLASSPAWSFTYDFCSGLVTGMKSADGTETMTFTFGSAAQRLAKTWANGTDSTSRSYLAGAQHHAVAESATDESGTTTDYQYIRGPAGLLAIQPNGADIQYVIKDHERSTRVVLSSDGTEIARFDYKPYGLADDTAGGSDSSAVTYRFTEQEQDAETGLYNYRHRLYDPATLRFISPDPKQQFFSPYIFVADNPLQHTDPTGEWSVGATLGLITGAVEVVGGAAVIGVSVAFDCSPGIVAGGAIAGAGIAGMGYSINTGVHGGYSWSKFGDAEAGGAIGGAEIAIGVLVLAQYGSNAAGRIGGSAMIGAGFSSLAYSSTAGNNFNWKTYGITMASGFVAGGIAGGLSSLGGALGVGEAAGIAAAEESGGDAAEDFTMDNEIARIDDEEEAPKRTWKQSFKKWGWDAGGGTLGNIGGQATNIGVTKLSGGSAQWSDLYSPQALVGDTITFGMGFLAAGISEGVAWKIGVGDYDPVKWRSGSESYFWRPDAVELDNSGNNWWSITKNSPMLAQKFVFQSTKFWGNYAKSPISDSW